MTDIPWRMIPPVIPFGGILLYAVTAPALTGLAYRNGAREIQNAVPADALRDETM